MGRGGVFHIFYFFPFFLFFFPLIFNFKRGSAAAKKKKTPELKLFILFKKARKLRRSGPLDDPAPKRRIDQKR